MGQSRPLDRVQVPLPPATTMQCASALADLSLPAAASPTARFASASVRVPAPPSVLGLLEGREHCLTIIGDALPHVDLGGGQPAVKQHLRAGRAQ